MYEFKGYGAKKLENSRKSGGNCVVWIIFNILYESWL